MSDEYFRFKQDGGKPSPLELLRTSPRAYVPHSKGPNCRWEHFWDYPHYTEKGFWLEALDLLPTKHRTLGLFEGLSYGEKKYARYSWRGVPNGLERYKNAALRHFVYETFYGRSEVDPESGLHHLSHAAASIAIVLDLLRQDAEK